MSRVGSVIRGVAPSPGARRLDRSAPAPFAPVRRAEREDRVSTRAVTFPVVLPDNNTYEVAGVLYWAGELEGKTLQITVHGASYDHNYWDAAELGGHEYSYARYMARSGFAVLAIDNLGTGASSRPDGDFVDIPVEALALHQLIESIRAAGPGTPFRRIVLVGHSMGSEQVIFEQGVYQDADGLVVTGWVNTPHRVDLPADAMAPLMATPYVGMPAWMRTMLFYAGDFDPRMPDYDNQHLCGQVPRGVFTYTMAQMSGAAPVASEGVRGPVLLVFAEHDVLEPMPLAAGEPATYPNASSVTTHLAPGIGHDINLHLSNTEEWKRIASWIRETVA